MLIEFSVANFRSFRERQTLSMVAAARLPKRENVLAPLVSDEELPDLLKVAAIYGPNASGKSNLLRALDVIPTLASSSPAVVKTLPVAPFRFDKDLLSSPSEFEVHFICDAVRYQFELSLTSERIVKERLISYPNGKSKLLYERRFTDKEGDEYRFGDTLEGGSELHQAWRRLTAPTSLFIAQAVANSNEDLHQLRVPFGWLLNGMFVIEGGMASLARSSQRLVKKNPNYAAEVASFLQEVDVPVTEMRVDSVQEKPSPLSALAMLASPSASQKEVNRTIFKHRTALGEAEFDFEEESEGTKGLVGFWLPWSMIAHGESTIKAVAVDEIDSSLHPEIVASLIQRYLASDKSAQLIFTTHDTHLMDTKLLRRDQFWLTERDANGATQLRSIHDFKGRESEDVEKRYFEGKYRGLPILSRG
ncbi:AAA family ATPase [Pseudoduganella sp. R-43]|uniref:AAA family ATPase n=1 Tax=Pseudoduganella sp. R-43 TaxID=3404063 RepID=UPI003CF4D7DE